jgi:L-amino acid N-acyltransferase YncA
MIRSDWQGTGLGTALQQCMAEYAKAKGLRGFTAEILMSNDKMLRLARSVSDKVTMTGSDGVYEVTMLF